jgi:hypothetical protein
VEGKRQILTTSVEFTSSLSQEAAFQAPQTKPAVGQGSCLGKDAAGVGTVVLFANSFYGKEKELF